MNKKLLSVLALIAMLGLAACGVDTEEDDTTVTPDTPVEVENTDDVTPEFNQEEDIVIEEDESFNELPVIEEDESFNELPVIEDEE